MLLRHPPKFLPSSSLLWFFFPACLAGLAIGAWAARQPIALIRWTALFGAASLVLFCLVLGWWWRSRQLLADPSRDLRRQGRAFYCWFVLHNLAWTCGACCLVLASLLVFGVSPLPLALAGAAAACGALTLFGVLPALPSPMLSLCWQTPLNHQTAPFWDRAQGSLLLTGRYHNAVHHDLSGPRRLLPVLTRILDRALSRQSQRGLDLMSSKQTNLAAEVRTRLTPLMLVFAVTAFLILTAIGVGLIRPNASPPGLYTVFAITPDPSNDGPQEADAQGENASQQDRQDEQISNDHSGNAGDEQAPRPDNDGASASQPSTHEETAPGQGDAAGDGQAQGQDGNPSPGDQGTEGHQGESKNQSIGDQGEPDESSSRDSGQSGDQATAALPEMSAGEQAAATETPAQSVGQNPQAQQTAAEGSEAGDGEVPADAQSSGAQGESSDDAGPDSESSGSAQAAASPSQGQGNPSDQAASGWGSQDSADGEGNDEAVAIPLPTGAGAQGLVTLELPTLDRARPGGAQPGGAPSGGDRSVNKKEFTLPAPAKAPEGSNILPVNPDNTGKNAVKPGTGGMRPPDQRLPNWIRILNHGKPKKRSS